MKYLVLIYSNPQPWGHPTGAYLAEHQVLPQERRDQMETDFDQLLAQMTAEGELVGAEALGDPATATVHRWSDGQPVTTAGPYSEGREHLAGVFLIDVADAARAEEIGRGFSGPGETIEVRPVM